MRITITRKDWGRAIKATSPTPLQQLKKKDFEAVDRPLVDGDIDRDDFEHLFEMPDEADLTSVQVEDDGSVWLRVTFFNSVDLQLSDLQLPQEVQERVLTQINQLRQPKRTIGRGKKTAGSTP